MDYSCGPQWMNNYKFTRWLKKLAGVYLLGWFFEASCAKHDEGYLKGGNWINKLYCDIRFFAAMIKDAAGLERLYQQIPAMIIAFVYFILVLCFGWFSFNYH